MTQKQLVQSILDAAMVHIRSACPPQHIWEKLTLAEMKRAQKEEIQRARAYHELFSRDEKFSAAWLKRSAQLDADTYLNGKSQIR
mgnify:CR=1 FL=1